VALDGGRREEEQLGDLRSAPTLRDVAEDLAFARRESRAVGRRARANLTGESGLDLLR
jgi:hypothetical protein